MKKLVINLSDSTFEKLRFEAIKEQKSIQDILTDRIYGLPFSADIEDAYQNLIDNEFKNTFNE